MNSFKNYLLTEYVNSKSNEIESMLVLQKVIDMVDDGHVDYDASSIKINVGHLIKNKKYNNLSILIIKGEDDVRIARHNENNDYVIVISTSKLPSRESIDTFLSSQERSEKFKTCFIKFMNDAVFDDSENNQDSAYEKRSNLNTRKSFEESYVELIKKLNGEHEQYLTAKKELDDKLSGIHDDLGHKETMKLGLDKLKKDMMGSSESEFKSKAINLYGKDNYKALNKEFKSKLDSRLTDYYESKIQ